MDETCATVRVVAPVTAENPLGFIVINESDLGNDHELYEEPKAEPEKVDETPKGKKGS